MGIERKLYKMMFLLGVVAHGSRHPRAEIIQDDVSLQCVVVHGSRRPQRRGLFTRVVVSVCVFRYVVRLANFLENLGFLCTGFCVVM